jgi:hypothetical protein
LFSQLAHAQLFNDDIYICSHNWLMLNCVKLLYSEMDLAEISLIR